MVEAMSNESVNAMNLLPKPYSATRLHFYDVQNSAWQLLSLTDKAMNDPSCDVWSF